jgi:hypothetical protein
MKNRDVVMCQMERSVHERLDGDYSNRLFLQGSRSPPILRMGQVCQPFNKS